MSSLHKGNYRSTALVAAGAPWLIAPVPHLTKVSPVQCPALPPVKRERRAAWQSARAGSTELLMTGFLQDNDYIGRPVDVQPMEDGSLLVPYDYHGAACRIASLNGKGGTTH
jgi:hypothetical protein